MAYLTPLAQLLLSSQKPIEYVLYFSYIDKNALFTVSTDKKNHYAAVVPLSSSGATDYAIRYDRLVRCYRKFLPLVISGFTVKL